MAGEASCHRGDGASARGFLRATLSRIAVAPRPLCSAKSWCRDAAAGGTPRTVSHGPGVATAHKPPAHMLGIPTNPLLVLLQATPAAVGDAAHRAREDARLRSGRQQAAREPRPGESPRWADARVTSPFFTSAGEPGAEPSRAGAGCLHRAPVPDPPPRRPSPARSRRVHFRHFCRRFGRAVT